MRLHQQGRSLTVETPAKLNLFLELLGRRPDGYHELETLLISVGLYDTLVFTPADSDQIELVWGSRGTGLPADLPVDERNLIIRAARLLRQHTGTNQGAHITLHKRIPVEAGMGGGSSDAAATLVGLNRVWKLGLPMSELHNLAATLGSDVNFFLDSPVAAVGRGRGEQITPVDVRGVLPFVIVKPHSGCSTAAVFRHVQLPSAPKSITTLCSALGTGQTQHVAKLLHNALQAPVVDLNVDVALTLQTLQQQDVLAAGMTGSGSACFGLCRSVRQARTIARSLSSQELGQVFSATSLT